LPFHPSLTVPIILNLRILSKWERVRSRSLRITSCRREAATTCPRPGLQVVTRYTSYMHLDPLLTRCPCWPASTANQSGLVTLTFDLFTFKVMSESHVTCANFSLPRLLRSRLRPDVRDRQTSDRQTDIIQHHRLMPLGGDIKHLCFSGNRAWTPDFAMDRRYTASTP